MAVPAPAARLGWAQVAAWRAVRHHLDGRAPGGAMLEVAARIAGVHAQVLSSAELTLWARVEGLAPDDVGHALWSERSLVKTWAMRGTLHLLPAAEYPMWQAALSTGRPWEARSWQRGFGVSLAELERLNAAVAEALDGRQLTREELATEVARVTGSEALGGKLRESWGALLKPAAALGLLCFAPSQGQQVRFTRPGRPGCWSAWARTWPGSRSTGRPPTPWPPTWPAWPRPSPAGPRPSGCSRPSTSMWSPPPARPSG
jgi:DNA glycosylase AlkZ-like